MTLQETKTSSKSVYFADLFFESIFEVPWHQRRYDWRKEHVIALLHDIDGACESKQECYFLGSLLLIDKGNNQKKYCVNDGQQRLMTYSLICAQFLQLFNKNKEKGLEATAMRILFNVSPRETYGLDAADTLEPRMMPSEDDKSRFDLMIRGNNIGQNGRLTTAWQEINKFVSALTLEKAKKYFDFFTTKVEVSRLVIPTDVDPNMVFETLNFRGKSLDGFDLVRNHLYSYFNDASEVARRQTIKTNLDENLYKQFRVGSSNKSAEYLRCYLQCQYGFLPAKEQFYRHAKDNIKEDIRKTGKNNVPADYVFDLVEGLTQAGNAQLFLMIVSENTNIEFIEGFNIMARRKGKKRDLKVLLDEMRNYKVVQPIFFALLNRYTVISLPDKERKKMALLIYNALQNITSFVMRTALIKGKFEPSLFESEFSALAQRIMKANSVNKLAKIDIFEELKTLASIDVMDDERFVNAFCDIEVKDLPKARRLLISINAGMQPNPEMIQHRQLTLEHILPRSDRHWKGWNGFPEGTHKDWVHKIGNLTLLGKNENKSSVTDNADISQKKKIFGGSILAINKGLAQCDTWTPEDIESRQKKIAIKAAETWSFAAAARSVATNKRAAITKTKTAKSTVAKKKPSTTKTKKRERRRRS